MNKTKHIKNFTNLIFRILSLIRLSISVCVFPIFSLFLLFSVVLKAQVNEEFQIANIVEDIIQNAPEDIDYSEYQDRLLSYFYNPLSLNTATKSDLAGLYILSNIQIDEIIKYREWYSRFVTIYELTSIKSLDSETLKKLILFVKVDPEGEKEVLKLKHVFTHGRNRLLFKYEQILEKQKGYLYPDTSENAASQAFLGSPQKLYLRFDHKVGNKASFGLTTEKDAGEELFSGNQKPIDFYSGHFYLADRKNLKHLAIGDYQANFGQGLVFHSGLSFGKNPNVLQMFKTPKEISPYRSVNEFNFLRGVASTYQKENVKFTALYSNKMKDGNLEQNDSLYNQNEDFFTSFYSTGYHRTQNEIDKKKVIREEIFGAHISNSFDKIEIGFTGITGRYDNPLITSSKPYSKYYFSGSNFTNLGTDYSLVYKNIHVYGELGYDTKSFANITGMIINIGSKINVGLVYRNYSKNYTAPYANAFRTGSRTQNEKGLYFAMTLQPTRNLIINAYADQFSFPWLKYQVDFSSKGFEYLIDTKYSPNRRINLNIRVKYYSREQNLPNNETNMNYLTAKDKLNLRMNLTYNQSRQLTVRTRVEYCKYQIGINDPTYGLITYQDFIYSPSDKLRLIGRYALFNTEDYYSRVYTYENDILYSFSIPGFSDVGTRFYIVSRFELGKNLSFWCKFARTTYFNKEIIGVGTSEIAGNHKTEVKFMLRFEF